MISVNKLEAGPNYARAYPPTYTGSLTEHVLVEQLTHYWQYSMDCVASQLGSNAPVVNTRNSVYSLLLQAIKDQVTVVRILTDLSFN